MAQRVKNPPAVQKTQVWSLGWKDPLQKGMGTHSTPAFLPGEPHGQRSVACYSPRSYKELYTTEQLIIAQHVAPHFFSDIIWNSKILCMGFPDNSVKNPPAMQEIPVQFLGQEDPLEKG